MNGRILWWDKRDGYGIAVDEQDNEYYIDSSAVPAWALAHMQRGLPLVMSHNTAIEHTRCAKVEWVNLQHALDKYYDTIPKLLAMDASELRPGAIAELEALVLDIQTQFKEEAEQEACDHSDDFENGHCIDCGEYVQNARHR